MFVNCRIFVALQNYLCSHFLNMSDHDEVPLTSLMALDEGDDSGVDVWRPMERMKLNLMTHLGYLDPTFAKIRGFKYKFVEPKIPATKPMEKPKPTSKSTGPLQHSIASYLQLAARNVAQ